MPGTRMAEYLRSFWPITFSYRNHDEDVPTTYINHSAIDVNSDEVQSAPESSSLVCSTPIPKATLSTTETIASADLAKTTELTEPELLSNAKILEQSANTQKQTLSLELFSEFSMYSPEILSLYTRCQNYTIGLKNFEHSKRREEENAHQKLHTKPERRARRYSASDADTTEGIAISKQLHASDEVAVSTVSYSKFNINIVFNHKAAEYKALYSTPMNKSSQTLHPFGGGLKHYYLLPSSDSSEFSANVLERANSLIRKGLLSTHKKGEPGFKKADSPDGDGRQLMILKLNEEKRYFFKVVQASSELYLVIPCLVVDNKPKARKAYTNQSVFNTIHDSLKVTCKPNTVAETTARRQSI